MSDASKDLSRSDVMAKYDFEEFGQRLHAESDRGVILIIAEHANNLLEMLLRAGCVNSDKVDKLFESTGSPLGSFGSRILAAYAFGLISELMFNDLEQLRKMRNHCAHHLMKVDFQDQKILSHLNNLKAVGPLVDASRPSLRLARFIGSLIASIDLTIAMLKRGAPRSDIIAIFDTVDSTGQ